MVKLWSTKGLVVSAATVAVALVFMGMASRARAQDVAGEGTALDRYRAEVVEHLPAGLSFSPTVFRGGREADLGFFGQDASAVFGTSPRAMEAMDDYRTYRIVGFSLWVAGLAALTTDLVLLLVAPDAVIEEKGAESSPKPLFWALLGGGAAVGVGGGLLMQAAQGHLADAIRIHNDDLYARLRQSALAPAGALAIQWSTSF